MTNAAAEKLVWHQSRSSFTQLPSWILNHAEVSDGALRTWLVLASYADRDGEAFPGVRSLAERRSKGRRQIFEHLDQLERSGALLRRHRFRDDGGQSSTLYVLAWSFPLNGDPPDQPPVRKSAPGAGARKRTGGGGAKNVTPGRAEIRAPRTTTRKELDPLAPEITPLSAAALAFQGGDPPGTPPSASTRSIRHRS